MQDDLLFGKECYRIVGAAMEVHSELGPGFHEPIYQEAMEIELADQGIPFSAQHELRVPYKGRMLTKTYIADVLCYEAVIVELKALKRLGPDEEAQLLNYMKAAKLRVGLLINFGGRGKLEWKRFVL